jgi:hypothetical protein
MEARKSGRLARRSLKAGAIVACMLAMGSAQAREPGLPGVYPQGNETYMTGALPPPGLYGMVFLRHDEADELKDNSGDKIPVDFKLRADAIAPRLVWVTGAKLFGGDLVGHAILPLVDLKVSLAGSSQTKSGIGDMVFGIGTGYHLSEKLHVIPGIDVFAPTGDYDKHDLAHIGTNHWGIQPLLNVTHVDPGGFNGDIKLMYTFNTRNDATDYKSGQEFHFDYDAGWGLGNGWVVGVGGYALWQTTDDEVGNHKVPDNKARAFAVGPAIKYDSGKGWFVTAKWQKDFGVRNLPEGDSVVIKAVFPL